MKKIIFASGLLALMAAATSCDKYDNIYPEEFDGVLAIKDAGTRELTVYVTDATAEVPFIVLKSGYDPEISADATLKVMDEDEFVAYQETSGNVAYARVGNECFSFSKTADEYSVPCKFENADDRYILNTLYVRPKVLKTWLAAHAAELEGKTPVIPVTLVSPGNAINENSSMAIVKLDIRTPALTLDVAKIVSTTIDNQTLSANEPDFYRPAANFSIPCTNPWGFTLHFESDEQAIADYNAENGTSFVALTADQFELKKDYHFAPGTTYMPLDLSIQLDDLELLKNYAVAVKLKKDSPVTWDNAENTPGEDLVINPETMTVIFTVRVKDVVDLRQIKLSAKADEPGDAYVTTPDQDPSDGSLEALFDGDSGTHFHSNYHTATERDATYGSYLQIDFGEDIKNWKSIFRFTLTNRNSPTVNGYVKTVRLFASNSPDNWPTEPFAEITDMNAEGLLDGAAKSANFGTDKEPFEAPAACRYLRFCVMASGGGNLGQPSTAVYWCASELMLYGH